MHFNHYGGPGAELAAELANLPADADQATVNTLVDRYSLTVPPLNARAAAQLRAWGDRLRPVFGESDVDTLVETVNGLLAEAVTRPYVSTHDGQRPHLHYFGAGETPLGRLRSLTAAGLAHLVCEEPHRLGHCADCGRAFVDTSRNGRRRFCTNRCANRVRVATHRERTA